MQVREAMSSDVKIASPNQTIRDAARLMAQMDCGCLPVGESNRLVGVITDRDIALRAVAKGKSCKTAVRDIMSSDVKYCFEDQELDEIAKNMADIKVRRLPVLNHEKRLVGILSLGDVALMVEASPRARCAGFPSPAASTHSRATAEASVEVCEACNERRSRCTSDEAARGDCSVRQRLALPGLSGTAGSPRRC